MPVKPDPNWGTVMIKSRRREVAIVTREQWNAAIAQAVQAAYEDAAVIAETICSHKGESCSFGKAPKLIAAALRARPAEPAGETR